jgi:hypothetical protein
MPLTLLLGSALAFAQSTPARGVDEMKPVPKWIQQGIAFGIREGLTPKYTEGLYRRSSFEVRSRYEVAVMVHIAVTTQIERTESALENGDEMMRASMIRSRALLPFYRRAAQEFRPELTNLGVEKEFGIARLDTLGKRLDRQSSEWAHPFRDVPADHWAAKAVGDLRALGMLKGYPDGRYRG